MREREGEERERSTSRRRVASPRAFEEEAFSRRRM